jgi:hypothetical protein
MTCAQFRAPTGERLRLGGAHATAASWHASAEAIKGAWKLRAPKP